eukprot:TRINITY_DN2367_c0_g1_i6.p1 TRINITY_DN2367_c0_g1~~TRINITY_DN2367_c0_g1_i6.p1  ORF type:complete len:300 (+),score=87.99 TRINITY_DN2367_c0_g1_i6:35-901(+)
MAESFLAAAQFVSPTERFCQNVWSFGGDANGRSYSRWIMLSPSNDHYGKGIERVRQLIALRNGEDRRSGFGPPPPSDSDGGHGFVNLSGLEDITAGSRPFNLLRRAEPTAAGIRGAAAAADAAASSAGANSSDAASPSREAKSTEGVKATATAKAAVRNAASPHDEPKGKGRVDYEGRSWQEQLLAFLPMPLTRVQAVVAVGMLAVTLLAFARGTEDLLPADVIGFLRAWMRLAWTGHGLLAIAAIVISEGLEGQMKAQLGWAVKVLLCGALGFQELLQIAPGRRSSG